MTAHARLSLLILPLLALAGCVPLPPQPGAEVDRNLAELLPALASSDRDAALARLGELAGSHPEQAAYRSLLVREVARTRGTRLAQASAAAQAGQWEQARLAYEQILALQPGDATALSGLRRIARDERHASMLTEAERLAEANQTDDALGRVREVLAESPQDMRARTLEARLATARGVDHGISAELAGLGPVNLDFRGLPLRSLCDFLTRSTGVNFHFEHDVNVQQPVNVVLQQVTLDKALPLVLGPLQLGWRIEDARTVHVFPAERAAAFEPTVVRTFFLSWLDARKAQNLVRTVAKARDTYIDERLNTLVVRDSPEVVALAEDLLLAQDVADAEIEFDVHVLEVTRDHLDTLGTRYPNALTLGVKGNAPAGGSAVAGQLTLREAANFNGGMGVLGLGDPAVALDLLLQDANTTLLASPQIRVRNREKARVMIGDRIPVITSTANATGFVSDTVNYLDVGIKLEVEPTVLAQDQVSLKVSLEVSDQGAATKSASGTIAYTIGTRNASTTLRLRDGETQVLAGLFRQDRQVSTSALPGLGSTTQGPGLFSDRSQQDQRKEVVLLVTPHLRELPDLPEAAQMRRAAPPSAANTRGASGQAGKDGEVAGFSAQTPDPSADQPAAPAGTRRHVQTDAAAASPSGAGATPGAMGTPLPGGLRADDPAADGSAQQ